MIKDITIYEDKTITLSNATEWAFIYSDQFGHDIVDTLAPVLSTGVQIIGGILEELGDDTEIDKDAIVKLYDSDAIQRALIYFTTIKITDLINITWAMAKAADETIGTPRAWVKENFTGEFPLDLIAPAVASLLVRGFVSSKNLERLQEQIEKLRPEKKKTKAKK